MGWALGPPVEKGDSLRGQWIAPADGRAAIHHAHIVLRTGTGVERLHLENCRKHQILEAAWELPRTGTPQGRNLTSMQQNIPAECCWAPVPNIALCWRGLTCIPLHHQMVWGPAVVVRIEVAPELLQVALLEDDTTHPKGAADVDPVRRHRRRLVNQVLQCQQGTVGVVTEDKVVLVEEHMPGAALQHVQHGHHVEGLPADPGVWDLRIRPVELAVEGRTVVLVAARVRHETDEGVGLEAVRGLVKDDVGPVPAVVDDVHHDLVGVAVLDHLVDDALQRRRQVVQVPLAGHGRDPECEPRQCPCAGLLTAVLQ
mmetsp:Transcript_97271/g.167638  ORF Transcript_97271/g.167638 Transcript_97271/m.167638 type:complete len:313 (+) Transcript_97271:391-1329(+)